MLDRYDPLDGARTREWEGPDRDRSGRPSTDPREHVVDPRDLFTRDLDLPRGHERERTLVRGHSYDLRGSESRTLATVGAFRVVSAGNLRDHQDRSANPRAGDLRHLREAGLVRTVPLEGQREPVVALTQRGKDLLDAHWRTGGQEPRQAFYAGVRKPRELQHDAQMYRAYLRAAERLTERGGRLRRVVLDYELKRDYQRFLQEGNRNRPDSDGRPERDPHELAGWALEHALPYFNEHVHFPDVRIEYDDLDGRTRHEDVEVTTVHYRGAHLAAAARSGFSRYSGASARVLCRGGGSGSGRRQADSRLANELFR